MLPSTTKTLFNIIREINLNDIRQSADLPVRLALVGEAELIGQVAKALGSPPWVSVLTEVGAKRPGDVLLRVSEGEPPGEPLPPGGLEIVLDAKDSAALPDRVTLESLEAGELERTLGPNILAKTPEGLRLSLARHVPLLRDAYARTLVEETSRSNAIYAASTGVAQVVPILSIPLNVADIVILTKNQLIMAYKLALAEGKKGEPQELMKEIVSVVGGGFFFRQVARELVGLIPAWGIVPKVAVSYAGTWVIGQTVHAWAAEGETTTVKEMRRYYGEALEQGKALASSLVDSVRNEGKRTRRSKARNPKPLPPPEPLDDETSGDANTPS